MLLIRQSPDEPWHTPPVNAYSNEQALQEIIARAPHLLPGTAGQPMAVATELAVASGYVDIVGVDPLGGIVVAECKLKANPEIRRQVIGQVFAYASSLWGMTYEAFDAAFTSAVGQSLADHVAAFGMEGWSEEVFRQTVAENLAQGRFRLIIVVDAITDELKRIVQYLNLHTRDELQVLALELGYIADAGVEILVPATYGEESARPKAERRKWSEESVFADLQQYCSPNGIDTARRLLDFAQELKANLSYGVGVLPWVTAQVPFQGKRLSVFSIGAWPEKRGVMAINFSYLRETFSQEALIRCADTLRTIPGVISIFPDNDFRKRPNFPLDNVLQQPGALETVCASITTLLEGPAQHISS